MPEVDTKCGFYLSYEKEWNRTAVVLDGEDAVKGEGETYLPKLSGQSVSEYNAYKARGSFFNATNRVLQGLTGVVIRKEPHLEIPDDLMSLTKNITNDGLSLDELVKITIDEVLGFGFFGCLVDMSVGGGGVAEPYVATYQCFDIINWRTYVGVDGRRKLNFLVLRESVDSISSEDEFVTVATEQFRVSRLDEDGYWAVQLYEEQESTSSDTGKVFVKVGEEIHPKIMGSRIDYIPFVFFNTLGNAAQPEKSLLVDVANLNIKHWQVSVDYYHGLHFCALPTPWAAGFPIESELSIGATKAWVSDDSQAQAGFLEFTGKGIDAIEKALDKIERQMAVIGARILEEQKRTAEVAETLKIRSSGDTASLATVVNGVERGLEQIFAYLAKWKNTADPDIKVTLNKDFMPIRLAASDIEALLKALMQNAISLDTFLYNLKEGEVLPGDRTIDDEKDMIEAEGETEFFGEEE